MGFKEVRRAVVEARLEGRFQHEERSSADEKNLLFTGEVSAADVAALLKRCRGDQHHISTHHFDSSLVVHVFKPSDVAGRWYIKCYLVEVDGIEAIFISVHR